MEVERRPKQTVANKPEGKRYRDHVRDLLNDYVRDCVTSTTRTSSIEKSGMKEKKTVEI